MELLDKNIKYDLLNYQKYKHDLFEILEDNNLIKMGLSYNVIGKTTYGYDIDCIRLGYGEKELFLVGGTHGSEIISVDFILQFLSNIDNVNFFDPNKFTIVAIPLLNPEGFDITTSSLKNIESTFTDTSQEFYLSYRIDDIFTRVIHDLNLELSTDIMNSSVFVQKIKYFFNNNKNFWLLNNQKGIPNIDIFVKKVNEIHDNLNYHEFRFEFITICNEIMNYLNKKDNINIHDKFFLELVKLLQDYFNQDYLYENIVNHQKKLHQKIFEDVDFANISNLNLKQNVEEMYKIYNYPLGSQATFDANGDGVNLNSNTPNNPGINYIKNKDLEYFNGARSNLLKYTPGPIGSSAKDVYNFAYTSENKALYDLIKASFDNERYLGTILYHGTGGMIYYEPDQEDMSDEKYIKYLSENKNLADIYSQSTNYRLVTENSKLGYGDLLRKTFPDVILIELSTKGGNPIGPYGEKENIINCFQDNYDALNNLLRYYLKELDNKKL